MKKIVFIAVLAALTAPVPAWAQFNANIQNENILTYVIPDGARTSLRHFIERERERNCDANASRDVPVPCVPADMPVSVYAPNSILPPEEVVMPVPTEITATLRPTPGVTQFVYAANNVYLIDMNTRRILDIVTSPEKNATPDE